MNIEDIILNFSRKKLKILKNFSTKFLNILEEIESINSTKVSLKKYEMKIGMFYETKNRTNIFVLFEFCVIQKKNNGIYNTK